MHKITQNSRVNTFTGHQYFYLEVSIVLFGLVWFGLVWFGLVWFILVWSLYKLDVVH